MKALLILFLFVYCLNSTGQIDTIKTYYENLNLKTKGYIFDNKRYEFIYFESGRLKYTIVAKMDSSIISMIGFNEDGDTTSIESKNKSIIYDREFNGVCYSKMKHGKCVGKSKCYINGKLNYTMRYKNGVLDGIAIGYDETTQDIVAKEPYVNGKLNGEGLYYKRGNILQRKILYENGCPIKAQSYNSKGELTYETTDKEEIEKKYHSTNYCK